MNEWCPFAIRRDGPQWKGGYYIGGVFVKASPKSGEIKHSAEGGWAGLYSVLDGAARSCWTFTVGYDRIEQHYPFSWNLWHGADADNDGGVNANVQLIGIEHLGSAGQPLTPYQIDATTRISRWAMSERGYVDTTRDMFNTRDWRMAEHNQVSDTFTDCPSGRIPWAKIRARLKGDEPMTPAEREAFENLKEDLAATKLVILKYAIETNPRINSLEGHTKHPPK